MDRGPLGNPVIRTWLVDLLTEGSATKSSFKCEFDPIFCNAKILRNTVRTRSSATVEHCSAGRAPNAYVRVNY